MTASHIERLFAELKFEKDDLYPPDDRRRVQFRTGWKDATVRHREYAASVLRRLTWRNLGYRFGERQGPQELSEIDAVYEVLKQRYASLWVPRSYEDHLLYAYWRKVGGRIYVEVPIGGGRGPLRWRKGSTTRRIDGVRLPRARDKAIVRFSPDEFRKALTSTSVELIEIKASLDRYVIGQVVAGRDMFLRHYGPDGLRCVIVCAAKDTALEWVCRKNHIAARVVCE